MAPGTFDCREDGCSYVTKNIEAIRDHLEQHGQNHPMHTYEFKNIEEYQSWVKNYQDTNYIKFINQGGRQGGSIEETIK